MVPVGSRLYTTEGTLGFHDSVWANVFWAHRLLDGLDAGNSTLWASAAVAAFHAATMLAAYRSYRTVGPIRTGLDEYGILNRENGGLAEDRQTAGLPTTARRSPPPRRAAPHRSLPG